MADDQNYKPIENKDEISIQELIQVLSGWFKILLSKWSRLVFCGIVCGILGLGFTYFEKPKYTATLTYALDDEKSMGSMGGALGLASTLGFDLGSNSAGGAFGSTNLMELMHSRSLIEKTLLTNIKHDNHWETLAEFYLEFKSVKKKWDGESELEKIKFNADDKRVLYTRTKDSILGKIFEDINKNQLFIYQKDKKNSIISIDVKSENELFAQYFCQTLVKVVSDFYIETKIKKGRLNVSILQTQVDSVRNELNSAIIGVAASTDNTFNLNPALNIKRTPTSKRQVDIQANSAILTQLVINLEMAKVSLRKETPLIQIIDTPILPLKIEKASKIKWFIIFSVFSVLILSMYFIISKKK